MRADIRWCSHDYTPSGVTTWAVGISYGDNFREELVWPPVDREYVYETSSVVIAEGRAQLERLFPEIQLEWVG